MLKKSLPALLGLMFAAVTSHSSAALPPKYLGIKDFKLCLATQEIKTYSAWCMPAEKPASCPTTSWEQLKALGGSDKLPDCTSNPNVSAPSPAEKPTDK
jgi:hypothetical protein